MRYIADVSLRNFNFCSGAMQFARHLTSADFDKIEDMLEDEFCDRLPSEEDIDNLFWYEPDRVAEMLGYPHWEVLEAVRDGKEVYWDTCNEKLYSREDVDEMYRNALGEVYKEYMEIDKEDREIDYPTIDSYIAQEYPELESIEDYMDAYELEECE